MSVLKWILSVATVLAIAACGGGGGSAGDTPLLPGPGEDGGDTPSASDIVLVLSAQNLANSGTETVVATATAIDANRNTVAGVPVTITVDSNGIVTPSDTVTDASGQLEATIGIGSDKTSRTMTVTATSGSITRTATVNVQDTGGVAATPSDLLLTVSSATLGNTGSQTVTATATALDAKRNVMPGVAVAISVDAGATAAPSSPTTNAVGVVTAAIGTGGDPTNRVITVTATVQGLAARTAQVRVVNSTTTVPEASDLILALSSGSLVNGGSSTITATVTAVDANRVALAGIPVLISVDSNAVAAVSDTATNANGVVTATVGIGADRSNRSVTVVASSGSITKSATFRVVGADLTASFNPTVDTGSTGNQIEYRLVDANNSAMVDQDISITAPGLPSRTGKTDINGKFIYTFTAPSTATSLSVTATAAGDTRLDSITVQAAGSTPPNATETPQSASLTPTPSVVSVNLAGSSDNQAELRALFLGENNLPVKNVRVRFDLDGNVNGSDAKVAVAGGGTFAYSDAAGVARGTFTSGERSSPTNGVTVRACWDIQDFAASACPNQVKNTLTVTSEALAVNIRTNNLVKEGAAKLTYIKEYVVMVVDAAGQAKADVLITPSVDLTAYYKGFFVWNGKVWAQQVSLATSENWSWDDSLKRWNQGPATSQPQCPNEDVNRNGVREAGAYTAGGTAPAVSSRQEDLNWNGDLDPRKSDVAIKMTSSARTDANGLAVLQIEYGKNLAGWVDFVITVTASGVSGTEARSRYAGLLYGVGNLPWPAADVGVENTPPAFVISPYGRGSFSGNTPTGVCTDTQ